MRSLRLAAAVLATALAALAGCGVPGTPIEPLHTDLAAPDDFTERITVEPLEHLPRAERRTLEGVGIDVPAGVEVTVQELDDRTRQMVLTSRGRTRNDATVVVTHAVPGRQVTDYDVYFGQQHVSALLVAEVPDLTHLGVDWDRHGYAVGLRGTVLLDDGEGAPVLWVQFRDPAGTRLIAVTAEGDPTTPVEDSLGYQMLRTVRIDNL